MKVEGWIENLIAKGDLGEVNERIRAIRNTATYRTPDPRVAKRLQDLALRYEKQRDFLLKKQE